MSIQARALHSFEGKCFQIFPAAATFALKEIIMGKKDISIDSRRQKHLTTNFYTSQSWLLNSVFLGVVVCAFSPAGGSPPQEILIEGEDVCGFCPSLTCDCPCSCAGFDIQCRLNASCERTLLMLAGQQATIPIDVQSDVTGAFDVDMRISNDNGVGSSETVCLLLDGEQAGCFTAPDTSVSGCPGCGWNVFAVVTGIAQTSLAPGQHQLTITVTGGDSFGVEIDWVRFTCLGPPCCGNGSCESGESCGNCVEDCAECSLNSQCDDGDPCTSDTCDNACCLNANNTAPCDDGDLCTVNDVCSAGQCAGTVKDCSALDDQCNIGVCNAVSGVCEAQPSNSGGICDDSDQCTTSDTCAGGVCMGGAPPDCDDGNVCTDDSCGPATGCVNTNNTAPCDDGNACTTSDTCSAGACVGGTPPNCGDGDVCTVDSCDSVAGCVNTVFMPCCGNGICEFDESCGNCQDDCSECLSNGECDDGDPCTVDICCDGCCIHQLFDEDNDGVGDDCDACPNTIPGVTVDAQGCPPIIPGDFDRDGDVDLIDFRLFQECFSGADMPASPDCAGAAPGQCIDVASLPEIRSAIALAPPGAVVCIAAGTYVVDSTIDVNRDDITLQGVGDETFFVLANDTRCPVFVLGEPTPFAPSITRRNITLRSMRIRGFRFLNPTQEDERCSVPGREFLRNNCVTVRQAENCVIENVTIENAASGGIVLEQMCRNIVIQGVESFGNEFDAIAWDGDVQHSLISESTLRDNGAAGISFDIGPADNLIQDCLIQNNASVGIFIRDSDRNCFTGCVIEGNGEDAVFLGASGTADAVENAFINNQYLNNARHGIWQAGEFNVANCEQDGLFCGNGGLPIMESFPVQAPLLTFCPTDNSCTD